MADTLKQVSEKVTCHEKFIEGSEPSGRDGARSRLITVEDAIKRWTTASNWIIGACITVITGVIVWLITSVLPSASAAHSIVMALLAK
jgi:hypothetical protein